MAQTTPASQGSDAISDNLYVTGIPSNFTEDQVAKVFSQYGSVVSVKVLSSSADKPDLACMVRMAEVEQAKWLIEHLDGNILQGMDTPVNVKAARPVGSNSWKGYGKGWGGYGGYGGVPAGYGWPMMNPWMSYMMMKGKGKGKSWSLHDFPAEKKVWVGNLDESVTFRDLHNHFEGVGQGRFAVVMKGKGAGTGGVAFQTKEQADEAIAKYNGTTLNGKEIQVDSWTRKEK
eukprot:TRINITY_DN3265_c0_g2_i1.p1 TRINITY_DN3265_c0_g2~~TRINITY_DN3265_c0_g2_i1.p1  ORF type:complete len:255 (-),score=56.74 TRINITY_DN3265_c0_g2_i1:34-726(-)